MPAIAAASKANELLNQVFDSIESESEIDHFTVIRLEREISQLPTLDARLTLKALLNVAKGEHQEAFRLFETAYQQFGYCEYIVFNYLYSLGHTGYNNSRWDKVYQFAFENRTPRILVSALSRAIEYCDLSVAEQLLEIIEPMEKGLEQFGTEIEKARGRMDMFREVFSAININSSDATFVVRKTLEVLQKMNSITHNQKLMCVIMSF